MPRMPGGLMSAGGPRGSGAPPPPSMGPGGPIPGRIIGPGPAPGGRRPMEGGMPGRTMGGPTSAGGWPVAGLTVEEGGAERVELWVGRVGGAGGPLATRYLAS